MKKIYSFLMLALVLALGSASALAQSITVSPALIEADAGGYDDILSVDFGGYDVSGYYTSVQFYGADAVTPVGSGVYSWLGAYFYQGEFNCSFGNNPGIARTAYFKVMLRDGNNYSHVVDSSNLVTVVQAGDDCPAPDHLALTEGSITPHGGSFTWTGYTNEYWLNFELLTGMDNDMVSDDDQYGRILTANFDEDNIPSTLYFNGDYLGYFANRGFDWNGNEGVITYLRPTGCIKTYGTTGELELYMTSKNYPTIISFEAMLAAGGNNEASFWIDGIKVLEITSSEFQTKDWTQYSFELSPSYDHTLEWKFAKSDNDWEYDNALFLDDIIVYKYMVVDVDNENHNYDPVHCYSNSGTINSLLGIYGGETYRVFVKGVCSGYETGESDPVIFTTAVRCQKPNHLTATNMTGATADISWAGYGYDHFNLYLADEYFTEVREFSINDNSSFSLSGLSPNTTYNVWVETTCDDDNVHKGPSTRVLETLISDTLVFRTNCGVALPYFEDFENCGANNTQNSPYRALPECWNSYNETDYDFYYGYPTVQTTGYNFNGESYSGSQHLCMNSHYASNVTNTNLYAVLPAMGTVPVNTLTLSFYACHGNDSRDVPLYVGVMEDPEDIFTFEPFDTISITGKNNSVWYDEDTHIYWYHGYNQYTVDFSNYTGEGKHIAFMMEPADYDHATRIIYIDDISCVSSVVPSSSCEITFDLVDSYGDGWNGNTIEVRDASTDELLATMKNEDLDGDYQSANEHNVIPLSVNNGQEIVFLWVFDAEDQYRCCPGECSWVITGPNGDIITQGSGSDNMQSGLELATYTVNCSTTPTPPTPPTCEAPVLTVDEVTATYAHVSWTSGAQTTSWQFVMDDDDDSYPNEINENYLSLGGLVPEIEYIVRVRAICNGTDTSAWSRTTFTTLRAPAVSDSWSDDFNSQYPDWNLANWGQNTANKWMLGTAASNDASKCLYISNDYSTYAYTNTATSTVYAYNFLYFENDQYNFEYDWKCAGESSNDYFKVCLAPKYAYISGGYLNNGLSYNTVPNGWIAVGTYHSGENTWQRESVNVEVPAGNYMVVILWHNNDSDGENPPAAIDNFSITRFTEATITYMDGNDVLNVDTFAIGAPVVPMADPVKEGYTFTGWDPQLPSTMPAENLTVQAQWQANKYTITATANPAEGGSVEGTADNDAFVSGTSYDFGTQITLTATANEGYTFTNWTKNEAVVSSDATYTFTVTGSGDYVANFATNTYKLTYMDGNDVLDEQTYAFGATITPIDNPTKDGYTFTGWNPQLPTTMPAENLTVNAQWQANTYTHTITATVNPTEGGTVEGTADNDAFVSGTAYDYGTAITLIAQATTPYHFANWTINDSVVSTSPVLEFNVAEDMNLVANFELPSFEVSVTVNPANGGTVDGTGTYVYGQTATLTATPATGYFFANWSNIHGPISTNATYEFTVTEPIALFAYFSLNRYTITATANPIVGGTISGAGAYNHGETVTLTATPANLYDFVNWTKDGVEVTSDPTFSFTAEADGDYVANFRLATCPSPILVPPGITNITAHTTDVAWSGYTENDSYVVNYRTKEHTDGLTEEFDVPGSTPEGWTKQIGLVDQVMAGNATLMENTNQYGWMFTLQNIFGTIHATLNIYGENYAHWLVTPEITIPDGSTMDFDMALTGFRIEEPANGTCEDDRFLVLVSTDNMATWTVLREWNNSGSNYVYNDIATAGEHVSIDLSNYSGAAKFAFYGESTVNGNGDNDLHIDHVQIGRTIPAGQWQSVEVNASHVTLEGLEPETEYEVRVQGVCNGLGESEWSDIRDFTTAPTCPVPTDLTAGSSTTHSVELGWTENGSATAWQICLNGDEDNLISANTNPFTIDGLAHSTSYTVKVRAYCSANDQSGWSNETYISTECGAVTSFPWTEDFNELTVANSIPNCWNNDEGTTVTPQYKWCYTTSSNYGGYGASSGTSHDGSNCVRFNSSLNDDGNVNFLKTVPLSLPTTPMELTFWYKNPTGGDFSVYISTDGGSTHETALVTGLTGAPSWVKHDPIDLSDYTGQEVVIVFKGTSNYGNENAFIYLDDVTVKEKPSCAIPTALHAVPASNSADLSWTAQSGEGEWSIYWKKSRETDYNEVTGITTTPYTLTGLDANTTYNYYVIANCSATDASEPSLPYEFTTLCGTITTFPWSEDFNELTVANSIPNCWNNDEGTTVTPQYKWCYTTSNNAGGNGSSSGTSHDGSNCVRFNSSLNDDGNTNFLKTVPLSLPTTPMELTFWYKNPTGGDFSVYISTDGGATHETALTTGLTGAANWIKHDPIDLSDYAGQEVVIVFKGTSNSGDSRAFIYLDDVEVSQPTPNTYTITATVNPMDGGTVEGTADNDAFVSGTAYNYGTAITLIAQASTPYHFANWTINGSVVSTSPVLEFNVEEDVELVANFELPSFDVTVTVNPADGGTVEGAGSYEYGQTATLTATPNIGYHFANWSNIHGPISTNATYEFTVTEPIALFAYFSLNRYTITATANPIVGGTISGAGAYNHGETVTLTATPANLYEFVNWTKDGVEVTSDPTFSFTAEADGDYVANFRLATCPSPILVPPGITNITTHTTDVAWDGYTENDSYVVNYRTKANFNGFTEEFNVAGSSQEGWTKYTGLVDQVMAGNADLIENTAQYGWMFTLQNVFGSNHATLNIYGENYAHWLVTPEVSLPGGSTMDFDMALTGFRNENPATGTREDDRFLVLVSTDNTATWTVLREWNNSGSNFVYNDIATAGEHVSIDLSNYSGTAKFAFYGESTVNGNGDNDLHIDHVQIGQNIPAGQWQSVEVNASHVTLEGLEPETEYEVRVQGVCNGTGESEWSDIRDFTTAPTCPVPTDLTAGTSTTHSVELGWTENGSATAWQICLNDDEDNLISANTNPFTIDGLAPSTSYTVKVRAYCDANDQSRWSNPISLATECALLTSLPYIQDFEDAVTGDDNTFVNCMVRLNNASIDFYRPKVLNASSYNHTEGGSKGLSWSADSDSDGDYQIVVLPGVDANSYAVNNLRLKFWVATAGSQYHPEFIVGVMTDPSTPETFEAVTTINNIGSTWTEYTADLITYTGTGIYVAIRSNRPSADWYAMVDDITLEEMPACPMPTDVVADNVTNTSAVINWEAHGTTTWNLRYREDGEEWVYNNNIEAKPQTLSNLTPNTTYFVQVQADCSSSDEWSTELEFSTKCDPITTFPWREDFESINTGVLREPCWVNEHLSGNGTLLFNILATNNGTNNTHQLTLPNMYLQTRTKLVLPGMTLPSDNYLFSIDVYRNDNYANRTEDGIRVFASTNGEIEGATELAFLPRVISVGDSVIPAETATGWYTYELPIPMSGTCYIILRGENGYGAATFMDNLAVMETPTCPKPTQLTAGSSTTHSVELGWTENGSATAWQICLNGDEDNLISANTNPFTIDGLAHSTSYTVKVRAYCGSNDQSGWSSPISFTTECVSVTDFPWKENFDALTVANTIPVCWNNDENTSASNYGWCYTAATQDNNSGHGGTVGSSHDGSNCVRFDSYYNANGNVSFLKTVPLGLPATPDMQLTFWYKNPTGGDFSVYISTDGGETHETALATGLTGATSWIQHDPIDLSAYAGQEVVIVFKGTSNYGNGDAFIYLDDVEVSQPTPNTYTITATANPTEGGTVEGTADNDAFVSGTAYDYGTRITLIAQTNTGYHFASWTINDSVVSTSPVLEFTVTEDVDLVANFELYSYTVTATADPANGGSVEGTAGNDAFVSGNTYGYGTEVTLTAIPATGYAFVDWTNFNGLVSTNATYSFTVTGNVDLTANFNLIGYTVTATADPINGGIVTGAGTFNYGQTATLTATPNLGYHFVGWNDGSTENPRNVTVTSDSSFTANFTADIYTLIATADPIDGGTVEGAGTFNYGLTATLTAIPATGYAFVEWNDGSTENPRNVIVTSDSSFTASFTSNTYTITATVNPAEGGSVEGTADNDVFVNGTAYNYGTRIRLIAQVNTGYQFVNWTINDSVVSTSGIFNFNVAENMDIVANFELYSYTVTATADPTNGGSVEGTAGNDAFVSGSSYGYGTEVTLTAIPATGYAFVDWTNFNGLVSTNATYSFTVTGNVDLTANFNLINYTVTATANPINGGIVTGAGTFNYGQTATLTATPNLGYHFVGWNDGSTENPRNVTVTRDSSFTANFTADIYTITATANPTEGGTVEGAGTFNYGLTATLTAIPATGYAFVEWNDGSTENPRYVIVTSDSSFTASFTSNTYTITATVNPMEGGTVEGTADNNAFVNGTAYNYGTRITLRAQANTGYQFVSWTINESVVSTSSVFNFTVEEEMALVANFELFSYTVTATADPTNGGSVEGTAGNDAFVSGNTYGYGTEVTLTAIPAPGYAFVGWSDINGTFSTNATYSFTVTGNVDLTANFNLINYTVTATANPINGGIVTGGGTFNYGQATTLTATPNLGYHFVGWNDGSTENPRTVTVTRDSSFTANFTADIYTVTATADPTEGGTVEGAGTFNYGLTATLTAIPATGYAFVEWNDGSTENPRYVTVTSDSSFTASFTSNTYTITATANPTEGGTVEGTADNDVFVSGTAYNYGTGIRLIARINTGYQFVSWTINDSVVSTIPVFNFTVEENMDVVANFELLSYTVTATANPANGGSVEGTAGSDAFVSGSSYGYGTEVTLTAIPATGYTFANWTNFSGLVSNNATHSFTVTDNVNISANFTQITYIVTAAPTIGGTVTGTGTYNYGNTATLTAIPNTGYHFVSWNDGNTENPRNVTVTSDSSFIALFSTNDYTITYMDGNDVLGTQTYAFGATITPIDNPTKEGYTFTGWDPQLPTTMPAENLTVNAQWQINSYTITATANPTNGGSVTGAGTYDYDTDITLTATAATGYRFINWTLDDEEVSWDATYEFTVYEDANYVANFAANIYTLTYRDGDNVLGTQEYVYGADVTPITEPTKVGYTFTGWSPDVPATMPAGNLTVYAQWQINRYTVTTTANPTEGGFVDGTGMGTYDYGTTITLTATANNGYAFVDWSDGITENPRTVTVTQDSIFVANFSRNSFRLTYMDGNNLVNEQTYAFGEAITPINAPERFGYTFTGWDPALPEFMPDHDVTVYAQWQINSYTVTAAANPTEGGTVEGTADNDVFVSGTAYDYGTEITLTATPAEGYLFTNWTKDGAAVSSNATYTFTVEENAEYVANFTAMGVVATPTFEPAAGTYVESQDVTIVCATEGAVIHYTTDGTTPTVESAVYSTPIALTPGDTTVIKAIAVKEGMTNSSVASATYILLTLHNITVSANPTNGGTVRGGGEYTYGEITTLTATANEGYTFVNWTLNGVEVSTDATYTFTVEANGDYVANFDIVVSVALIATDNTICEGGEVTLSATLDNYNFENLTYEWYTTNGTTETQIIGATGQMLAVVPSASTTYKVYVLLNSERIASDEITITVITLEPIGITPTPSNAICDGGTITLTASNLGQGIYTWYRNAMLIPDVTSNIITDSVFTLDNDVTTYNYNVTFSSEIPGCTQSSPTITITVYPSPTVTITGESIIYNNTNVVLTANVSDVMGTATYTYQWMLGNEDIASETNSTLDKYYDSNENPYIFTVRISNEATGCAAVSEPYYVTVNDTASLLPTTYEISATANPTNGGTVSGAGTYVQGETATLTATANTGYTFTNWTLNGVEVSTDAAYTFTVEAAGDYVANFSLNTYTLTYMDGNDVLDVATFDFGQSITPIADPTKEGYTFNGWNPAVPETMPAEDVTVNAQWTINEYTLTYMDGNDTLDVQTYTYGAAITAIADPTKEGYTFNGWNPAVPETMPAEDLTVNAQWTINNYEITINQVTGGTIVLTVDGGVGQTYRTTANYNAWIQLDVVTFDGYTFGNYVVTDANNTVIETPNNGFFMPASNVTVTATFTVNEYTVTYMDGNDVLDVDTFDFGQSITPIADPTKVGYTFTGWDPELPATMPAEDLTVFAQWQINSYNITATANPTNGGTVSGAGTYNHGATATLTATANTGYTFTNWTLNGVEVSTDAAYTFTVEAAGDYVANFTINSYTVTYMDDNDVLDVQTYDFGQSITPIDDPAKVGHTFTGWDPELPEFMPAEDLTVFAQWQVNSYVITVAAEPAEAGTVTGAGTYTHGATATLTATANTGFTFTNWTLNGVEVSTDATYTFTVETAGDYIANFTINSYTVTYMDGNDVLNVQTFDFGQRITPIATPTKVGYTFTGWDPELPEFMPAEDLTVFAQWQVNSYTVTYMDDNDVLDVQTYDFGQSITPIADPEREGYTFIGWDPELPNVMPAENLTVFAQWQINSYTVTVVSNDDNMGTVTGGGTFDYGSTDTVTATAYENYTFIGWSDAETADTRVITVTRDSNLTAYFIPEETEEIEIQVNDTVMGSVELNFGGSSSENMSVNTMVEITATPEPHYHFVSWSDGNTENPRMVTLMEALNLTAIFAIDQHTITVLSADESMGTVSIGGTFDYGTEISISADALPGYEFVEWNDGNTNNPRTITVEQDSTFTAYFQLIDGINDPDMPAISIYSSDNHIVVINAEGFPVQIFDMSGRLIVRESRITESVREYTILAPGVYLVKVGDNVVKKVTIIAK